MNCLLFKDNCKDTLGQLIDAKTHMEGGILRVKNGVLIDGQLKNVTIVNEGDEPVVVSALGNLVACSIETHYFLNEGAFSGQVTVSYDAELSETSTTKGTIQYGRRFVLGGPLTDAKDLKIEGLPTKTNPIEPKLLDSDSGFANVSTSKSLPDFSDVQDMMRAPS